MKIIRNAAAAVAAAALVAACGGGSSGSHAAASAPATSAASQSSPATAGHSPSATASHTPSAAAVTSPAGSTPAGRLTIRQAQLAYVRIVGPGNVLAGTVASDASGAPFSQFRTDALAYAKELRTEIGKFQAVRWPTRVQSRITALTTTTLPADIRCLDAQAAASSMSASMAVSNSNSDCQVADNSTIPTSI
jgi:hypothetical protein